MLTILQVFHFQKGPTTVSNYYVQQNYPSSYSKLPSMLYVNYIWNDRTRNEWFSKPHWLRHDLLNARAHGIPAITPVMPINLAFDTQDYSTIRILEGLPGAVGMYLNENGYLYYGFITDMERHMVYAVPTPNVVPAYKPFFQGEKANLAQFQGRSGPGIARGLQQMYITGARTSVRSYSSVIDAATQAHRDWVNNGGYTITDDPLLGANAEAEVNRILQLLAAQAPPPLLQLLAGQAGPGAGAAGAADGAADDADDDAEIAASELDEDEDGVPNPRERLQSLLDIIAAWSADNQEVVQRYREASHGRPALFARFMVHNEPWNALSEEDKEVVIEFCELEDTIADQETQDE